METKERGEGVGRGWEGWREWEGKVCKGRGDKERREEGEGDKERSEEGDGSEEGEEGRGKRACGTGGKELEGRREEWRVGRGKREGRGGGRGSR